MTRIPKIFIPVALMYSLLTIGFVSSASAAVVTYTYKGPNFTSFSGVDNCSSGIGECAITASVTLSARLGGGFSGVVTPTAFTVSDGTNILTESTPGIDAIEFFFITGPSGAITSWNVDVAAGSVELFTNTFGSDVGDLTCGQAADATSTGLNGCAKTPVGVFGQWSVPNSCDLVFPDSVSILPAGPLSTVDRLPTAMTASFHPVTLSPLGVKIQTTLGAAESACGYSHFNFQQLVTNYPASFFGIVAPFLDPPQQRDPKGAYPFYYSPGELLTGINRSCAPGNIPVTFGDTSLNFCDAPQDSLIGLGRGVMQFQTALVGVPLVPNGSLNILYQWNWSSSFDSQNGGVQIAKDGGTRAATQMGTNGGFGTGGVTLTSINGVPIATFSAFSNRLEATTRNFELVSNFTLGSTSDGINPLTETTVLAIGSYTVTIPADSFRQTHKGRYIYEGRINGEHLELEIVSHSPTTYTLKAEGSGVTPIKIRKPVLVVVMIGNDVGVEAAARCRSHHPEESSESCDDDNYDER